MEERGVHWAPLHLRRNLDPRGDLRGSAGLYRDLRQGGFDIVHTHHIKVGLIGRVVSKLARMPLIIHTMHGLAFDLSTSQPALAAHAVAEKVACRCADLVLAQTREDRRTVIEIGAVAPEKVVLVGNGIDLDRFRPDRFSTAERQALRAELGVAPEEILFLTAGRLVREKGLVELFEALESARRSDPRIRLAVAGEIDHEKSDALDMATLDAARRAGVLILGQRDDMPALHAASDVFVLASWREGMSRVLMEAAASGKALLATDVRGCREIVRPGVNGLQVPVRSASSLARALERLAADRQARLAFGRHNAREARERYDVRVVADRVVRIYEALLEDRHSA